MKRPALPARKKEMTKAKLTALGAYVPSHRVDNSYFESILDTTEEWIVSRTGIKTRYYAGPEEFTSQLCVEAVRDLERRSGKSLEDVDQVIVSTVTPDQPMPAMSCRVQYLMGLSSAGAFDISAACAGFVYGLIVARGLVESGSHRKVLVIGAETLTKVTNYADRTSCVLFGDGAGAALVEAAESGNFGTAITGAYGAGGIDLYMAGHATSLDGQPMEMSGKIVQNGRKVFRWAVQTASEQFDKLMATNGWTPGEVDWFVPHSANLRILEAISQETGFPIEKFLESVTDYGNTSSATIPLALWKGLKEGRLKTGDRLVLFGFGGGLTYAGLCLEWP